MRREREGKEENDEAGAQAEAAPSHVADTDLTPTFFQDPGRPFCRWICHFSTQIVANYNGKIHPLN